MPCNSEYLNASGTEVELSRVACLLDELDGKKWSNGDWDGYHPRIYNKLAELEKDVCDAMVSELCSRLQGVDVKKYSLEMQMWWRDHQEADKLRVELEIAANKDKAARQAAVSKLTPHERKLLGLA